MSNLLSQSTTNRRVLLAGAAAALTGTVGVVAALSRGNDDNTPPVNDDPSPTPVQSQEAAQVIGSPTATEAASVPTVTTSFEIPAGMALVTSPRLPLFGVGSNQAGDLITGAIPSWQDAGSPINLEVEPVALEGQIPDGMTPVEQFADYDALVRGLGRRIGGLALVPVDQIDFRVNVLAVDGVDPLRDVSDETEPLIRIGVVGDIVPGRNVGAKMRAYDDYTHPFLEIAAELSSYDITFANLEGNLSSNIAPPADAHTFSFVADPAMIDGMILAGIDAVSLANNHSRWNEGDAWGESAFIDTMEALEAKGMAYFGGGRDLATARAPWVAKVKGKTIAILGIDGVTANEEAREPGATVGGSVLGESQYAGAGDGVPGTNPYMINQVTADISAAARQYDIVIPYFHFGIEYVGVLPDWAVTGARLAIDAGASAVVTNHPHVIQGMEVYDGKPIVYSVGNFIFDQMFSIETRQGLILELDFRGNQVVGLRTRGVEIVDFNQPRLMTAGEHASLMDRFWWSTDRLAARD